MVIIPSDLLSQEDIEKLQITYPKYIKLVVDVSKGILAVGGKYHIDCEEEMLKTESLQEDLYGGGVDIENKTIDYMAMSNYKPAFGKVTYEVADLETREKMKSVIKKYFGDEYE